MNRTRILGFATWLRRDLRKLVSAGLLSGLLLLSARASAELPWLGVELKPAPQGGARIVEVIPGSPLQSLLASQQLKLGEVVVAFDGRPIAEPKDLAAQVRAQKPGQTVTLRLRQASGQIHDVPVLLLTRPSEDQLQQLSMQLAEERQKQLIGQLAPEFVIEQLHGPKLPAAARSGTLSALKGQPVLLVFFASWCGPCLREIPHLNEVQARRPDLRLLALSTESKDKILDVISRYAPGYSVGRDMDRKAYDAFGVASYPTSFLIDGAGIVRAIDHGTLTTVEQALEKTPKGAKGSR